MIRLWRRLPWRRLADLERRIAALEEVRPRIVRVSGPGVLPHYGGTVEQATTLRQRRPVRDRAAFTTPRHVTAAVAGDASDQHPPGQ